MMGFRSPLAKTFGLISYGRSAPILRDRASNLRKDSVGVGSNQSNCADDDHENYGEHYSIFSDVLAFII
jgi:hypothetical protein